jgi:hypothetical protein
LAAIGRDACSKGVHFLLGPGVNIYRSLAYYDTAAQKWTINPGTFNVMVGRSSQQTDLRGALKIDSAIVY